MTSNNKQYGLIIPSAQKKKPLTFESNRNVFGSDSDDEFMTPIPKKKPMLDTNESTKKQVKLLHEKAIKEDPTVFQYDELYDHMQTEKQEVKAAVKKNTAPKYIENLMVSANKRKRDLERRMEKKIQKEREQEGDQYSDKEAFVTSAYKKKLDEMKLEEEKEKREAYLEQIGDVTKQQDLGGFYRHLYEQKLGKKDENMHSTSLEKTNSDSDKDQTDKKPDSKKPRNYRTRQCSKSEGEISDEEVSQIVRKQHLGKEAANIDADSDFSIDESSSENDDKIDDKHTLPSKEKETKRKTERIDKMDNIFISTDKSKEQIEKQENTLTKINSENNENIKTPEREVVECKLKSPTPPPKIDIWAKRTVGEKFEDALRRYYERKNARNGAGY